MREVNDDIGSEKQLKISNVKTSCCIYVRYIAGGYDFFFFKNATKRFFSLKVVVTLHHFSLQGLI